MKIPQKGEIVALDTETISLEDKTLVGFSFAFQNESYYVPVKDKVIKNYSEKLAYELLSHILQNCNVVCHNSSFDLPVISKFGVPIPDDIKLDDTVIMANLIDENIPHGLKKLVKKYFDHQMIELKELTGSGKKWLSFDKVEDLKKQQYAEDDARWTLALYWKFKKELDKDEQVKRVYYDIERPLLPLVAQMHIHGVRINVEKVRQIGNRCKQEMESAEEKLKILMGEDINFNSSKQLREYFIDKVRMPVLKKSNKTGQPSVDHEVLEVYAETNNEAKLLLDYRKYAKIYSTFISALTPTNWDTDAMTGYIYPSFNQAGTVSGRFSSSNPNCQNIPHDDDLGLREVVIPDEGDIFIGADYCVNPNTKILKTDLSWVDAEKIQIGDELIGFDEFRPLHKQRQRTKFRKSKVIGKKKLIKPCYKIITDKGEVISSNNHLWLTLRKQKSGGERIRHWIKTEDLTLNDRIAFFVAPWDIKKDNPELQYLAGFFDGEGWLGKNGTCGWGQKENIVLKYTNRLIDKYGYSWNGHQDKKTKVWKNYFTYQSKFKFLGEVRPIRLLKKAEYLWLNKATWNRYTSPAKILSIKYVGEQEVVALETSTRTFIANGFLSHNCQIELRILAHFSQDPNLLKAYNEKKDIHTQTADALGLDRYDAKTINFGLVYGMGAKTLSKRIKKTYDEAQFYLDKFFALYFKVREFWAESEKRFKTYGYVQTYFGRKRRRTPYFYVKDEYEQSGEIRGAINSIIQGTAADLMKIAMSNMYPQLKKYGAHLLLTVHDEVLVSCPYEYAKQVYRVVYEAMMSAGDGLSVPVEVDCKFGRTWAEAHGDGVKLEEINESKINN